MCKQHEAGSGDGSSPHSLSYVYSHTHTLHHILVDHIMAGACATKRGNIVRQEVRDLGRAKLVLYYNPLVKLTRVS